MTDSSETTRPRQRLSAAVVALVVVALVVVALVIAGVVAAVRHRTNGEPADRAVSLLAMESKFDSSREAVANFALVYQRLVDATKTFPKDCDVAAGKGRCLALNEAASWSLNFSTSSAHCTQPAVQQGRLAMLDYVQTSIALDDAATKPPSLPPIPTC